MNRRIRVMFAVDSLNDRGGTENQLVALIRGMNLQLFEPFIVCIEDGETLRQLASRATPLIFPMKSIFSFNGVRQILRLRGKINTLEPDVLHTFMVRTTLLGVLAAYGSGCKVVLTSRRNLGQGFTPLYIRIFRILNRMTSRVVANSEAAKRAAMEIEGLPASGIDVLYNGVDLQEFSGEGDPSLLDRLGVPPRSPIVGIVANYRAAKDLPMFLRAASQIAGQRDDVLFLMVGRGPLLGSLKELAVQLGIADKVFFTDGVGSVSAYLPFMKIGCISSLTEGFSNAILEYMAAGLAVVATNVGGNREAIVDGVTGFLTPPGDEAAFANRVLLLLQDEDTREAMGHRGRARCAERYELRAYVRRQEDYYLSLLNGTDECR